MPSLTNQRARRALFTCVVHTNDIYDNINSDEKDNNTDKDKDDNNTNNNNNNTNNNNDNNDNVIIAV